MRYRNSTSISKLALCCLLALAATGCQSTLTPSTGQSQLRLWGAIATSDILSRYDTSNLVGVVVATKKQSSIVTHTWPASGRTNWDGTSSWAQAQFADLNTGSPWNIGAVIFNKQLANNTVPSGESGDYMYNGNDLPFYTDGSTLNYIAVLASDSSKGHVIDSLAFSAPPSITNIVRGQNISRSSPITVNWTGTSSDFVSVNVVVWDSTGSNDTLGHGFIVGGYFDNTGSVTLPIYADQLVKGLADIELRKYEPKFITLSNGKRVAVVGETSETITVHIVD